MYHRGVDYILFLYWRGNDPWQGKIIVGVKTIVELQEKGPNRFPDLFAERNLFFSDEELEAAKQALIEIFTQLYDAQPAEGLKFTPPPYG